MPAWVVPLLFLGFSAGLSNFGGAVGLGVLPLERRHRIEILVAFVSMEVLMPAIGLLVGSRTAGAVGARANLFAGVVLVLIGLYTLWETRKETRNLEIPVKRRTIILLAVALSLDNLVVGFGLGLLNAPVALAAGFMGLSSLVLTVIGLELGKRLGKHLGERSELFSGLVLVAAGLFVIIHR
ncbi:MAG: manganese efflux pump MntP family protein [Candidatus Dormibacteraeota bacterium]|nr:manganese efflux pump MntP family protein [Candidatus Dormibacteraeota bacterium]